MGQDGSKSKTTDDAGGIGDDSGVSLWEGVPEPVLWLVQAQVRALLTNHSSALAHRPESLQTGGGDDSDDEMMSPRRAGELQMNEAALAHSALRDKTLAPRLQRALDKLVPAHLSDAAFWDNFFSHVDVIKVQIVTDYLTAQDAARGERM